MPRSLSMTTDDVRCPYCVAEGEFKLMRPFGVQLMCERCGHAVYPNEPNFKCLCQKCVQLNRQTT
jgi:hypothetical protein